MEYLSQHEEAVAANIRKIFRFVPDNLYYADRKPDDDLYIQNSFSLIILTNAGQTIKAGFNITVAPDVVANLALNLNDITRELVILENFTIDQQNHQMIFGDDNITKYISEMSTLASFQSSEIN